MNLIVSLGFTNHGPTTSHSLLVEFSNFPHKVVIVQQGDPWSPKAGLHSWLCSLLAVKGHLTGLLQWSNETVHA